MATNRKIHQAVKFVIEDHLQHILDAPGYYYKNGEIQAVLELWDTKNPIDFAKKLVTRRLKKYQMYPFSYIQTVDNTSLENFVVAAVEVAWENIDWSEFSAICTFLMSQIKVANLNKTLR